MPSSDLHFFLRAERDYAVDAPSWPRGSLALFLLCGSALFGAALGAYGARPLQMLYSALKLPILLSVSTLVCLPSFYVLSAVLGLAADFRASLRALLIGQATLAVVLGSFAPLIEFLWLSGTGYDSAIVASGAIFALGTFAAQLMVRRHYEPLVRRNPRHRVARGFWLLMYVFVGIQLAWVLRPFIGSPNLEVSFFRQDAWSNAYVKLAATVRSAIETWLD